MAKPEDRVERIIAKDQLIALFRAANATKAKVDTENGKIGQRLKAAADNGNLDTAAFRDVLKLIRMESLKRSAFMRNRALYYDMALEAGLIDEQTEMDLDDQTGADDESATEAADPLAADEAEQVATNVHRLQQGVRQLSDEDAAADAARRPSGVTVQ